jgi:hypothetical protein
MTESLVKQLRIMASSGSGSDCDGMRTLLDEAADLILSLQSSLGGASEKMREGHEKTLGFPISQLAEARNRALEEVWNELNGYIKQGDIGGNGCDPSAQRNGIVLAANLVLSHIRSPKSQAEKK